MPRLMNVDANRVEGTVSGFQFSAVEIDKLEGSEYTLVSILVDCSSSVLDFKDGLENAIKEIVEACKKSPRSENLLIRVATFTYHNGVRIEELHGFALLNGIDPGDYVGSLVPEGMTPLLDACGDAIESIDNYGKQLFDQDYLANGIFFVLTDGWENKSKTIIDPLEIGRRIKNIRVEEHLESLKSILIGINLNNSSVQLALDEFKKEAEFDEFIPLEDASSNTLAKLASFVSQSISSTSQSLGTGGASQPVNFEL